MSIERFRNEGWFDNKTEEVSLPELSSEQLLKIKNGEEVTVTNGREAFVIYIRKDVDQSKLSEADLIIRRIPAAALPPDPQL